MNYKALDAREYEEALRRESERLLREMQERMRAHVDDAMYGRSPRVDDWTPHPGLGGLGGPGPGAQQQQERRPATRAQFLEVCRSPRGLASFARAMKQVGTRGLVRRFTVYGAANGDIHVRDERHMPPPDVELLGIFTCIEGGPRVFRFDELT